MIPRLRVRTGYSYRNAYGTPKLIMPRLKEIGCEVAAIVDDENGGTWGHTEWESACISAGIEPAFGFSFSFPDENDERRPLGWALSADTRAGYRLSSSVPFARERLLNRAGVIVFAGAALTDPAHFDYIDLDYHSLLLARRAIALSEATGKPLMLAPSNDYPAPSDKMKYLAWDDNKRMTPQHILDDDELRSAYWFLGDKQWGCALGHTKEIGERLRGLRLAKAPIISVPGNLWDEVRVGQEYRLATGHIKEWTPEYEDRLQREMDMIAQKKYESYFLVVGDMVRWAKERMIVGPARGSSAGSLVCYLSRITEVDPLVHNLLFERFIDVTRSDLPDIDIDFSDQHRYMVFDYMTDKYGRDSVARLGNISRLQSRSVLNHVGKKMGIPAKDTYAVADVLIEHSSGDSRYGKGLEDTLTETENGRKFAKLFPEAMVMTDLEGHPSHTSVHAAGLLVSNLPIIEYCTVRDGIAHVDKVMAGYLELLKIDALGLRTLGVIEDAGVVTAEELYRLPLDEPAAFDILNSQRFAGIFQFEGKSQRRVSAQMHYDDFSQIDHVTALARPGPMAGGATNTYMQRLNGKEPVTYVHASMVDYLQETQGVIIYQEQVMRICFEVGRLGFADVSEIRKAMSGSKGSEFFDRKGEMFLKGAIESGLTDEQAKALWKSLVTYGSWCVSGDTVIQLPVANQYSPRQITVRELYENGGYAIKATGHNVKAQDARGFISTFTMNEQLGCIGLAKIDGVIYSGEQETLLVKAGGKEVRATSAHEFWTRNGWKPLVDIHVGDEISIKGKRRDNPNRTKRKIENKDVIFDTGLEIEDAKYEPNFLAKKFRTAKKVRKLRNGHSNCELCSNPAELGHHVNFTLADNRVANIQMLCGKCHKEIHAIEGHTGSPMGQSFHIDWHPVTFIGELRTEDTYDIQMPAPNHSFLGNDIILHNCMNKSHTVSYAIIAYWTMWLKAHYPLKFAAALLRAAKDDEQTMETLRELAKEGVEVISFNLELSSDDWVATESKIIGGFKNMVGVGDVKAAKLREARDSGTLTAKQLEQIANATIKFADLRPAHTMWQHMYDNPTEYNIRGRIKEFGELADMESAVVICRVERVDRRDENEAVRINRRGSVMKGQSLFADVHCVDDSVSKPALLRINRRDWLSTGVKIADRAKPGEDWLLVRGKWLAQFGMFSVEKVKCLTNDEMFK